MVLRARERMIMAFEQKVMKVSPETYARVTAVRDAMATEKHRMVTYEETVEYLLTFREQTLGLSTAAGR